MIDEMETNYHQVSFENKNIYATSTYHKLSLNDEIYEMEYNGINLSQNAINNCASR